MRWQLCSPGNLLKLPLVRGREFKSRSSRKTLPAAKERGGKTAWGRRGPRPEELAWVPRPPPLPRMPFGKPVLAVP